MSSNQQIRILVLKQAVPAERARPSAVRNARGRHTRWGCGTFQGREPPQTALLGASNQPHRWFCILKRVRESWVTTRETRTTETEGIY